MDNKILVVIDGSYLSYYIILGAFSSFLKNSPDADRFRDANSVDQNDLPNILSVRDYMRELHEYTMKRIETVDWILKKNFQEEIDIADQIDILCVFDDKLSNSFRKKKYGFYKAQRKLIKRAFDIQAVKEYLISQVMQELKIEEEHNWRFVKVNSAEGDDVAAVALMKLEGYKNKILIASDKDFLQLPDVRQFDLTGKEIKRIIKDTDEELSPKDFLLWKIVRGDVSDNIKGVFPGYGEKKSLKLIHDRENLKKMLKESQESAQQFVTNKFLMDFSNIPKDLSDMIISEVKVRLQDVRKNNVRLNIDDDDVMNIDDI